MKRRSGNNRPTLRNIVGHYEGQKRGEHPACEKNQQDTGDTGVVAMTYTEHQGDRARGAHHRSDQGDCPQQAKYPIHAASPVRA